MPKPRIYIAAPLFSEAERDFNRRLKEILSDDFEVFLPQDNIGLLCDIDEGKMSVFNKNIGGIRASNVVLLVLDGPAVDDGVGWEHGYAYAIGKPCIGLVTDWRHRDINPMIECSLKELFLSIEDLIEWARAYRS